MNTTKYFIYARKSTDDSDRQIRSIDDQLAEIRELAARHSFQVIDVLVEKQSAKKPGRPIFNDMLARIEQGEAAGILSWHPDRLARNMLDGGRIIHMIDTGVIADMKFPSVDFQPTSQGKLTLAVLFGFSKYYVDALSENIRRGQRQKIKNGIWPQIAPVGYVNDRKNRIIVPDPLRSPLVRKAFELYATGDYTLDRITEVVNDLGLTIVWGKRISPMSRAQYHRMFQNPIYCGILRYKGELHQGAHEPIITKTLFDQVQRAMEQKSKPKTPTLKPYLYRGIFRCGECGCWITTETQKGHNYIHCTKRVKRDCSQPFMREELLGEQVTKAVRSFALNEEWADWMINELETERAAHAKESGDIAENIKTRISEVEQKLDRLMTAFVEGALSLPEYKAAKNKLVEEKTKLAEALTASASDHVKRFEPIIRFLKTAKQAGFLANGKDLIEQRDFLKKRGSNLTITDRTLTFIPRDAWQLVVDSGRFAQHASAAPASGAASVGETDQITTKRSLRDIARTLGRCSWS